MKPHFKILLGLILGAAMGSLFHAQADMIWLDNINQYILQPIGQIFLRLIFMIVVPMVFSALVIGVFELGKSHGLGRVAYKTLLYTVVASALSVVIGISLVNLFRPGKGFQIDLNLVAQQTQAVEAIQKNAAAAKSLTQSIVDLIPKNPLDSAARALEGEMIALMVFALIFGLALSFSAKDNKNEGEDNRIIKLLENIFSACAVIIEHTMRLAPYAVFAIVFNTAYKFGHGVFASLFFYVAVVVIGLLCQQFVVYPVLLKMFSSRSPWQFFKQAKEVYLYAFSTASSNATLPLALDVAENKLQIPARISRFVLTVGSTANQNGTALFEGVTVLFLAQVYGVDLTLAQQIQVVLMSILAGVGTAGVPGGSLPLIMILLQTLGVPAEGMALVLGVDRFLDMCRTTLNVSGDLVIAALVSNDKSLEV